MIIRPYFSPVLTKNTSGFEYIFLNMNNCTEKQTKTLNKPEKYLNQAFSAVSVFGVFAKTISEIRPSVYSRHGYLEKTGSTVFVNFIKGHCLS